MRFGDKIGTVSHVSKKNVGLKCSIVDSIRALVPEKDPELSHADTAAGKQDSPPGHSDGALESHSFEPNRNESLRHSATLHPYPHYLSERTTTYRKLS